MVCADTELVKNCLAILRNKPKKKKKERNECETSQLFSEAAFTSISHFSRRSCRFKLKTSMPFWERCTPSTRYRPVFAPQRMLSWVREVPPNSEMIFWIRRFTVVRTKSTSWLSTEWRHTLRGRILDHTRTHCGKMLLIDVKSFLTEASRSVGLSVLRSFPPRCRIRTSGLGQVIFSWWSCGSSWDHVMPWVPFHQTVTLPGSMPSCIPTSGDLARDSAQYTSEWPTIQTFLGSLLTCLPGNFNRIYL